MANPTHTLTAEEAKTVIPTCLSVPIDAIIDAIQSSDDLGFPTSAIASISKERAIDEESLLTAVQTVSGAILGNTDDASFDSELLSLKEVLAELEHEADISKSVLMDFYGLCEKVRASCKHNLSGIFIGAEANKQINRLGDSFSSASISLNAISVLATNGTPYPFAELVINVRKPEGNTLPIRMTLLHHELRSIAKVFAEAADNIEKIRAGLRER